MSGWRDASVWLRLADCPEAVDAAASIDGGDPAAVSRLRRRFDSDLASAAIELAEARRRAGTKFAHPGQLWCDVAGVEQASGERVAAWKAARIARLLGSGGEVLDLCCGIGGDAMAMAAAGLRVTAVDIDPRRAWMAGRNAGCATEVADVESFGITGAVVHADPARREERGGSRSWSLDDHRPGRAWIERAMRDSRGAAVKLSPGVDRRELAAVRAEWEYIEDDGRLVQAVAWCGVLAGEAGCARATILAGSTATLCGKPDSERVDRLPVVQDLKPGQWISEPSPALERAQLLTEASGGNAAEIERGLGLVASSSPLPRPWFDGFIVVEECPARGDAIRDMLARHGLSARSVRVRGRAADADALTKALGARPGGDAVVFVFRRGERSRAVAARLG